MRILRISVGIASLTLALTIGGCGESGGNADNQQKPIQTEQTGPGDGSNQDQSAGKDQAGMDGSQQQTDSTAKPQPNRQSSSGQGGDSSDAASGGNAATQESVSTSESGGQSAGNDGGDSLGGSDNPANKQEAGVWVIRITGNDQMQYNIEQFTVPAGAKLTLTLEHVGDMSINAMGHNVVITEQGTNPIQFGAKCQLNGTVKNDYLPKSVQDTVIAYTELLGGGEKDQITFKVPEDTGKYPFVCTFPAHAATMNGEMVVK